MGRGTALSWGGSGVAGGAGGVSLEESSGYTDFSAPAEGHVTWTVTPFFDQRLVELAPGPGVDAGPAVLTVVLQACNVGTKEWGEFAPAASPLTLVTHLVVQHIWFHLHLRQKRQRIKSVSHPERLPDFFFAKVRH